MSLWAIIAVYLWMSWTTFRIMRKDPRSPWWLTVTMCVCSPLVMLLGFVIMASRLRLSSFRGFIGRQRKALGLTALAEAVQPGPDDGGFLPPLHCWCAETSTRNCPIHGN